MGNKRLSDIIDYSKHIEPYRIIEIVSGVGSGKNYWVENVLMEQMRVLLITSRKAKVEETKVRIGVNSCLNLNKREKDALNYFWDEKREYGSCICSNWQIDYYMKNRYRADDENTYLWQFFDIVVVDEAHSLATDATYTDVPFYLFDFIRGVYKQGEIPIVLMTATHAPIDGLLNVKKEENYHYWDCTKECRNLLPDRLWFQTTEQTLNEMVRRCNPSRKIKGKWVYFATRTDTIAKKIIPFLVESGIPEKEIAVSFSKEEVEEKFSQVILDNKKRVEEFLKDNEDIPEDITYFITTSRNKEGINIDNPDYYWNVVIESHWTDEAAQMWGRIRSGLTQKDDENKAPTNKVVIVYDAPQHTKHYYNSDFSALLSENCLEDVNKIFNQWCAINEIPKNNRIHNQVAKREIDEISKRFPYLRYSVVNDKFYLYKGKKLGQQSFAKSIDNFKAYVSDLVGEPTNQICVPPFSIQSFLIMPPQKSETFEDYLREKDLLNDRWISPQEQKEMLDYISDVLMVRQKSDSTKRYNTLAKALSVLGYGLRYGSHNSKSDTYGCVKLVKLSVDDGGVFSDSI